MPEHVLGDVREIEALLRNAVDDPEARRGVAIDERRREIVEHLPVGHAEDTRHVVARERLAAERDDLIEEAHRVAHRPCRFAREDRDRGVVGRDRLVREHLAQPLGDRLRRNQLEVVALAAAQDRDGNLVHLRRREDELHVGRRLLQRLQKRVPRLVRQHVDFVDDVDLEAVARGAERDPFLELSHLVDAVVRGAVDLLHVDVVAGGDLFARRAHLTRDRRRPGRFAVGADAIEALGEEARARRLADAADPREEERVGDAVGRDGVGERPGDVLLAGKILERLRAVFAGEDEVTHSAEIAEARSERERRRPLVGYDAGVPHDAHFLERLDRVRADETDLALGLYRDHELVRFVLSHAKLEPGADRVAIALADGGDGPWIVVARSGAFVTCLGKGMMPNGLAVVSRAQLDGWREKHDEVRRRVAIARERGALDRRFIKHVLAAGRWLSREDFLALSAVAAPLAGTFIRTYVDTYATVTEAIAPLAFAPLPRGEKQRLVFTQLARASWSMGHLALAMVEGADREWLRVVCDTMAAAKEMPTWLPLYEQLAIPFVMRAAWCNAKLGKLALPGCKAEHARPWTTGVELFESWHAVVAIGIRHAGLRAEAFKALHGSHVEGENSVGPRDAPVAREHRHPLREGREPDDQRRARLRTRGVPRVP